MTFFIMPENRVLQQLIYFMWHILRIMKPMTNKNTIDGSELYCSNPDGYILNEIMEPNGWFVEKNTNGHGVDNIGNYNYRDENGNEIWDTTSNFNNPNGQTYPVNILFLKLKI